MSDTEQVEAAPRRSSRNKASSGTVVAAPALKKKDSKKRKAVDAGSTDNAESSKKTKKDDSEEAEAVEEEFKQIALGDPLPDLLLKNEKGEDVKVQDLTKDKGVVLFLIPKADTPGCTTQACGFRDTYSGFTEVGYDVYCLSADSPTAQTKWQTKKTLPYSLLSDPKRELIKALGAGKNNKTARSHFIFEKSSDGAAGGKLLDKKMPVKPADSPKLALEFIKGLTAEEES